ncbi:MAG TPA: endonuclease/exonuclease/phosphatase family protein [Streptosporangiaceae bacterium]
MRLRHLEWMAATGLGVWAAARLAGADRIAGTQAWTVPWLAFTPQAAVGACVGAVALRSRGPRIVAGLAGVALSAAVLPRAIPRRQPQATGPVLRVLTANLLGGRAQAAAIVDLVQKTGADVLFVQDLDDEAATALEKAGLGGLLNGQVTRPVADRARGGGIYARYPLENAWGDGWLSPHGGAGGDGAGGDGAGGDGVTPDGGPEGDSGLACGGGLGRDRLGRGSEPDRRRALESAAQCAGWLRMPSGQRVRLVCVHAPPPKPWNPAGAARWRRELAMLPPPGLSPVTMAGDFNATLDHLQFRRLLRRGYRDAAGQVGRGLRLTWGPRPSRPPALLTLDHVLIDPRCAVRATSVHRLAGSDHHALYAEIGLPG